MLAKSCKCMLKRKIINDLTEWKKNVPNKALLIKGARQVGKNYGRQAIRKSEL